MCLENNRSGFWVESTSSDAIMRTNWISILYFSGSFVNDSWSLATRHDIVLFEIGNMLVLCDEYHQEEVPGC